MKLISFTVPCYNSRDYMKKCIESLLIGGDDVEIIIVNDGSKDDTLEIARGYEREYPDIVSVIDKPNGGHGSGVNAGIARANGLYFKVVDSDDWLDKISLLKLIAAIKKNLQDNITPDLYLTNFIYDHASDNTKHVSDYKKKFVPNKLCTWDKMKSFWFSEMMLMHSLMYKVSVLRESGLKLPEHTFYVDNIFAYIPLPHVKTVFYLDLDLYHYFIGRADQSVNSANFIKRYEQQLRVTQIMFDAYTYDQISAMPEGLRKYMIHNLLVMSLLATFFTCAECSKERKAALKALWQHVKQKDVKLYKAIKHRAYMPFIYSMPWRLRGRVMRIGYYFVCKKVKLG